MRCGDQALEILQSQVELRPGGETGVASVRCLSGADQVWPWLDSAAGSWTAPLLEAAMRALESGGGVAEGTDGIIDRSAVDAVDKPHLFEIHYTDGLRAVVLMLGDGYVTKMAYADRRQPGDVTAVEYHVESTRHAAFGYLSRNIEEFLLTGVEPSPLERTYMTTGLIEAVLRSRGAGGERLATPALAEIAYIPTPERVLRARGERPSGGSEGDWSRPVVGAGVDAVAVPITRNGTTRGPLPVKRIDRDQRPF